MSTVMLKSNQVIQEDALKTVNKHIYIGQLMQTNPLLSPKI